MAGEIQADIMRIALGTSDLWAGILCCPMAMHIDTMYL